MSQRITLQQLMSDVERWRLLLPEAQGTYCQGIANKAFGEFELLLKQLLADRLAATEVELSDLLVAVQYQGKVQQVEKLPPGTLVQTLIELGKQDEFLRGVFNKETRRLLDEIIVARNLTTHEVLAPESRARTEQLIDLIEQAARSAQFRGVLG